MSAQSRVEISGAGPAGLAAAIVLARAGRQVTVFERRPGVGHRFHGDFQGLENWSTSGDVLAELASDGIEATFEHAAFHETRVFDPLGTEHRYRSQKPLYYLVRRGRDPGTLDSSLRRQAEALGVELRFGEPRRQLRDGGIVAEGPHGSDAIAVGLLFETDAPDGAYAAISDRLAYKGYSYLLIHEGRGTIATCMFGDFHREREYLERTVSFFRSRLAFEMRAARRFGGTGNLAPPRTARRGSLLYVGEAAGFQDPLFGFGMRYAMTSGVLAARALISGEPERYDGFWQARFGRQLRAGVVNRALFERGGAWGYRQLVRRLDRAADPRDLLRRLYDWSWLKAALHPWARRAVTTSRRAVECLHVGCQCTWCRCRESQARPPG